MTNIEIDDFQCYYNAHNSISSVVGWLMHTHRLVTSVEAYTHKNASDITLIVPFSKTRDAHYLKTAVYRRAVRDSLLGGELDALAAKVAPRKLHYTVDIGRVTGSGKMVAVYFSWWTEAEAAV